MNILISGSLAYDRIMDFPGRFEDHILPEKIHILNVCFTVNGLVEKFGGTAGNIAYNLSLLRETPTVVAAAGRDFARYERWLTEHGLPLTGIRRVSEEFTASAYITTDLSDNQITGFNPGAMKHPALFPLEGLDPAGTIAIVSPGNLDDMVTYSRMFRELGIRFICDPGQSIPALTGDRLVEMFTGAELLITNDYELEMIRKATEMDMPEILECCPMVVTTLGEEGSTIHWREEEMEIPPVPPAKVADPTGAGDAYRSGMLKGIVTGKDWVTAAQMGATCASFAVEEVGTQEHDFRWEQFVERYERFFGESPEA
ncbi:MAG: carbohydrate kinase family protein [Desulfobacteraceae bacterium]|nr:carbohydrate kinase family protein [Desulfobacteraceae bacterium]